MEKLSTWRAAHDNAHWLKMQLSPCARATGSCTLRSLLRAGVCALALAGITERAQATDPSVFLTEIITPAGWEVRSSGKHCSWASDAATNAELVTPDGWRDTQAPEPSWTGSCMCSELVVPDAWASTASAHAGKRK